MNKYILCLKSWDYEKKYKLIQDELLREFERELRGLVWFRYILFNYNKITIKNDTIKMDKQELRQFKNHIKNKINIKTNNVYNNENIYRESHFYNYLAEININYYYLEWYIFYCEEETRIHIMYKFNRVKKIIDKTDILHKFLPHDIVGVIKGFII